MDALAAPAWVVALATAAFLGAKAVVMVRNGSSNGFPPEFKALVRETTNTLTALTARLQQLPTREELKDVAQINRRAYREDLHESADKIIVEIGRTEKTLVSEIARRTA